MEKKLNGLVTGVSSGDTIKIQGKAKDSAAPPTKELHIAYIKCPAVGSAHKPGEPFGFAAREFIRKLVLGKVMHFSPVAKAEDKDFAVCWVEAISGVKY